MRRFRLPEKECPECKGNIDWKVVRRGNGAPAYNGLCKRCNSVFADREAPEITEGHNLEQSGKIKGTSVKNIPAMDKRITSLPCDVQIGILRERQHDADSRADKW